MKKLLLLAGILVVGAASFAGGADWSSNSVEKELQVTATVIENLKVQTHDVEFGRVAAGMQGIQPKNNGKIEVEGVKGASVKIELRHGEDEVEKGKEIAFGEKGSPIVRTPLYYTPDFEEKVITLNGDGYGSVDLQGSLRVPENTPVGDYAAVLTTKVYYTGFANE